MADAFLEEIYQESRLLTELRVIEELARKVVGTKIYDHLEALLGSLGNIKRWGINEESVKLYKKLERLTGYDGDKIWLGDYLEMEVIPACMEYLSHMNRICVDDEQGYCLESSESGFLTLRDTASNKYYHSKVDPMWEARTLVRSFYDPRMKSYSLLGSGLGYIAYQLYRISDGSIKITLFEYEERLVQYARNYGVLDWIPDECLEVRVEPDILPFLYSIDGDDIGQYIFRPEMRKAPEDTWPILEELVINDNTALFFREDLKRNFYKNIHSNARPISEFDGLRLKKEFIIVAGGPSLDERLDFLRENKGKKSIIAVGTVFRKLVQCNILPDLVTMMDPKKAMAKQLKGVENQQVPLLLGTTAYWYLADRYQGEKYLVPTRSILQKEEAYAEEYGLTVWECGGTVTMMAVQTAIHFDAEAIYLVGADFAYPGYISHATGTDTRVMKNADDLYETEAVTGGRVYTDPALEMFRHELEEVIGATPEIAYYNMSTSGARIAGTRELGEDYA